jgi:replicative DNA helicase
MTNFSIPRSIAAEQSLIGACIYAKTAPTCSPEDFTDDFCRFVAQTMQDLERKSVIPDVVAIGTVIFDRSTEWTVDQLTSLIDNSVATDENLEVYLNIVKESAAARRLQAEAITFAAQIGKKDANKTELIESFSKNILSISDITSSTREIELKDTINQFLIDIEAKMYADEPYTGMSYGLEKLDTITCGMEGQEYIIIAARPSMGKTALALQIIIEAGRRGERILVFSLDMSFKGLRERMFAYEAKVNLSQVRSGNLIGDDYSKITQAAQTLKEMDITVIDVPCTEMDIVRKTRKIKPTLVIIDFLQKVVPSIRTKSPVQDMTGISKTIKNLLKEQDIPGIVLSQLNRDLEREKRPPVISDLRESGAIEQDADSIFMLHANEKTDPVRSFIIGKLRQGKCQTYNLYWTGATQTFSE